MNFDGAKGFSRIGLSRVCLVLLCLFFGNENSTTQTRNYQLDHLSTQMGLSNAGVNAILQDRSGFMWFGTSEGLNRYDGYSFTTFKNDPADTTSLSNNEVFVLFEDRGGELWIGTAAGLNRFDPVTGRFIHYRNDPKNSNSLSNNIIRTILEDRKGNLWVGTSNGLNRFDPLRRSVKQYHKDPENPNSLSDNVIFSIFEDHRGFLWIGTHVGGINRLDPEKDQFTHYLNQPEKGLEFSANEILSFFEDRSGLLWIGTAGNIITFDLQQNEFSRSIFSASLKDLIKGRIVYFIYQDQDQIFWIGTDAGLFQLDLKKRELVQILNTNQDNERFLQVKSICEDRSGLIWFGHESGVDKFDRQKNTFINYRNVAGNRNSLSDNNVTYLLEDQSGFLWIGTESGGLNRFDRKKNLFTSYKNDPDNPQSLSTNTVRAILEDRSGELWVGTMGGGMNKLNRTTGKFKKYMNPAKDRFGYASNFIFFIYEDRSSRLWLGTLGGFVQFDRDKGYSTVYRKDPDRPNSISDTRVRTILEDHQGFLWIGTSDGLNHFDPDKKIFTQYKNESGNPNSLTNNNINCLYEDKRGMLWIGTSGGGINRLDPRTGEWQHLFEKDGLPSDYIFYLIEDNDGYFWASTKNGLSKFHPDSVLREDKRSHSLFMNYFETDGIQGNNFYVGAGLKSKKGELYFGGKNGFTVFKPHELKRNNLLPPIVLTGFKKVYQPVRLDTLITKIHRIDLNFDENIITFEFAALDFKAPSKNQYAYKLEGFNKSWIYLGNKHDVTFTNLNPENYLFRVKASNNDGVWNENGISLSLIVHPPFWQTWWFRFLSVSLLVSLVIGGVNIRTANIRKRNKNLEEMNRVLSDQISERKMAEEALRSSESRNRALLNAIPDMMLEMSREGTFLAYKPAQSFAPLVSPDQFIGKNVQELLPPPISRQTMEKIETALQTGESQSFEYQLQLESGLEDFEARIIPSSENSVLCIVREITERKRAEKLQQVVYNIADAVNTTPEVSQFYQVIQGELSKLIDTTNFFIGLYDSEKDTISLPFMKDEKDRFEVVPAARTISALVINTKQSMLLTSEEMIQLEREGKVGKVGSPCKSWLGVPLKVDHEVIGIIVVQSYLKENAFSEEDRNLLEFVSNQVAISIKKKQSEEQIRKLSRSIEQSPSLIVIADLEGTVEYANPRFTTITGYSVEEVKEKNLRVLFPEATSEEEYQRVLATIHSGKEWRGEMLNHRKNREPYWEFASISPIKNDRSEITHFLIVKDDITQIKQLQQQLNQSQKMESIGTLVGGIAHDFNNILTVVKGHAEISLTKLKPDHPVHRDVISILHAGEKAENLIRQLLAFSRKQVYEPKVLGLNTIIKGMNRMLHRLIGEDIQVRMKLSDDLPNIKADRGQLEQILINLFINARDALNERTEFASEKKINIETERVYLNPHYVAEHPGSQVGPHVLLSISDNGMGMEEEVRNKIFEPFFTTKEQGKGTGLGLATVYGIVKQNRGSIYVYSEWGHGTTFKIFWPITEESPEFQEKEKPIRDQLGGDENILLVEDDAAVLNFATLSLQQGGYFVFHATNGKEALKLIKEKKPKVDLLITDLIMPEMSGKELADKIRKIYPSARILFTSGYTDNHIVQTGALERGINFIQKPYSVQALARKVREILDNPV